MEKKSDSKKESNLGREVVPVETALGSVLSPAASDEVLVASFKRYQELKSKLLCPSDYTHFVKFHIGDSKPKTKGFAVLREAEGFATDVKNKGFSVVVESRIKKSGVQKLSKAFCVSTEVVSENLTPTSAVYRVRAFAPNKQSQERTGACDRSEMGRGDSPWDHIVATALTRAVNRASMALLGGEGEITAEETAEDHGVSEAKTVTATPVTVVEVKRPEQKTEAEIKADLDKAFQAKEAAKPATERNELLKRLFSAAKKAGLTNAQLKLQMHKAYQLESTKDLSLVDLEGFAKGIEELARINAETAKK